MAKLDRILKSRDSTLSTKVSLVKAMVFPVVMYGCESWTIKKAERWRVYAFELWCWRRFLRVCWTARRSNQSILKEISPGCSLEGLMLNLKLQYCGHLMRRADSFDSSRSFEKTLMLGKIEGRRRKGRQRMTWQLNGHGFGWTPGVGDGQEGLGSCGSWGCKESDMPEWLNWTEHYLWGSWGKNTRVDCHFLFWWTTFCHSFIELWKPFCPDNAVIHVIILVSILIVIFILKPVGL